MTTLERIYSALALHWDQEDQPTGEQIETILDAARPLSVFVVSYDTKHDDSVYLFATRELADVLIEQIIWDELDDGYFGDEEAALRALVDAKEIDAAITFFNETHGSSWIYIDEKEVFGA